LQQISHNTLLIATTGKTGRELFELSDRPNHFYMVGSMGCASSLGLGVALYQPNKPVVVLDGDGAALMRLEAMVSVGHYHPPNLTHIILDNEVHDSTGGQQTLSSTVRFSEVALACGYQSACTYSDADDLASALTKASYNAGPHLIHLKIKAGSPAHLGRPTLTPAEIAARFRQSVLS
jgi:phosphonopyruvate decarboxylase